MNTLYYGDNLQILRDYIAPESVGLIYLDPPFNSNRDYNVYLKDESGQEANAQIMAFEDTWHWSPITAKLYDDLVTLGEPRLSAIIGTFRQALGTNQMMAYLVMMAARLVELHRVLKPTGSLYLHCDPTASHYLKLILDAIFGAKQFRNEIVWKRMTPSGFKGKTSIGRGHDVILCFSKTKYFFYKPVYVPYSEQYIDDRFNKIDENGRKFKDEKIGTATSQATIERLKSEGRIYVTSTGKLRIKHYLDEIQGVPLDDVWMDIPPINSQAAERLGYPTQKPVALLERILKASSNEGDVVLDPFCGCGTTIAAAQKLNRKWIGIDITHLAVALQKYRLKDAFNLDEKKDYQVIGEPEDIGSARQLALDDRYQFQWWALSLVKARPVGNENDQPVGQRKKGKKGADRGIDGVITFVDEINGRPRRIIIQVKSGHVKSGDIRDLNGVITREEAVMGLFISLEEPTREMKIEAAAAGFYYSPGWHENYPKLQIITISDLLNGVKPQLPPATVTFKQAPKMGGGGSLSQKNLYLFEPGVEYGTNQSQS